MARGDAEARADSNLAAPVRGAFLDTSGLYAAADPSETRHEESRASLEHLVRDATPLTVSDIVVAELHSVALRRVGSVRALTLIERLLASPRIEVISTGPDGIERAVAFLRSRPDKDYSLADAVAMLLMRDRGIEQVFTLDADFQSEGFATIPG
jgi:predicted nucleic acid-binding protein